MDQVESGPKPWNAHASVKETRWEGLLAHACENCIPRETVNASSSIYKMIKSGVQ